MLQQTYTLMERAVSLNSDNSDYITELGFQLLLQGKVKDAMRCYKNAMKIDETSVSALTGLNYIKYFLPLSCNLYQGWRIPKVYTHL